MNWKKFAIEASVFVGLAAAGILYAPALLAAESVALILGVQAAIGAFGLWGLKKSWDDSWNTPSQAVAGAAPKAEVQPQKYNERQNKVEKTQETERPHHRWGMKLPRFISKHKVDKKINTEKENYRDAA